MPERLNGLAARVHNPRSLVASENCHQRPVGEPEPLRAQGFESHSLPSSSKQQEAQKTQGGPPASPAVSSVIYPPQHRQKLLRTRSSFADAPHWERLASRSKVRLPAWRTPMSPRWMESWLKRLKITHLAYREQFGFGSFREFIDANPDWPLAGFVGLLLEKQEQGKL